MRSCASGVKIPSLMRPELIFMLSSFEYSRVIGWRSRGRGYTLTSGSLRQKKKIEKVSPQTLTLLSTLSLFTLCNGAIISFFF